jgi:hypothetical protein
MDSHNLFLTRATYRAWRLEHLGALAVCVAVLLAHIPDVRWWAFVLLFAQIDLIGYLPGAIAFRRRDGAVPARYYVLYNVMHSFLTQAAVAAAWWMLFGAEWALLALPIHLLGDRALFGNFLKPFCLSFEPKTHPSYSEFQRQLDNEGSPV